MSNRRIYRMPDGTPLKLRRMSKRGELIALLKYPRTGEVVPLTKNAHHLARPPRVDTQKARPPRRENY